MTTFGESSEISGGMGTGIGTTYSSSSEIVTYVYDAFGNRIERDAWDGTSTTVTRYGLDGWDPAKPSPEGNENFDTWVDLNASNTLTARYVWGPNFDEVVARQNASGSVGYYLTDDQGSVREVIDNSASVLASSTFDAFGNLTAGSLSDRYGYTGQQHDALTGLISYGNGQREDNPTTGRFNQTDPDGFTASGPNLYTYVKNAPTDASDPSGQWLIINKSQQTTWQRIAGGNVKFAPLGENQLIVVAPRDVKTHQQIAGTLEQWGVGKNIIPSVLIALYGGDLPVPLTVNGDLQDYHGTNFNMFLYLGSAKGEYTWNNPVYDDLTRMSAGIWVMRLDQFDKSSPRAARSQAVKDYLLGKTRVYSSDPTVGYQSPAGEHLGVVMLKSRDPSGMREGLVIHGTEMPNPLHKDWTGAVDA